MGLVIFAVMGAYLVLSIGVVVAAVRGAGKRQRSKLRWGVSAALVMWLIPFWDWIPTVVMHRYYCEKEAGFWMYKTIDQWKRENPGVAETLVSSPSTQSSHDVGLEGHVDTYRMNQRFNWVIEKTGPKTLNRWRWEKKVIDTETDQTLVRLVDFSTGDGYIGGPPRSFKFWLKTDHCPGGLDKMYAMDQIVGSLSTRLKGNAK